MKLIKKIKNKIKENLSYKTKYEVAVTEIELQEKEIERLLNEVTALENKLDTDTQALIIDRLEKAIIGYKETIKKLRESDNKRMKINIENREKIRTLETKIKKLEQDLRIAKKVGA